MLSATGRRRSHAWCALGRRAGRGGEGGGTAAINDGLEKAVFVAKHDEFPRQIKLMLGGGQGGEARLDVGLLIEEATDGAVNVAGGLGG